MSSTRQERWRLADHVATIATLAVLAVLALSAATYITRADTAACERGNALRLYAEIDNDSRLVVLRERIAERPEQDLVIEYQAELAARERIAPLLAQRDC